VKPSLLELAEEPGLWLPPEPSHDVVFADGYCVVSYGRSVWVHRIRLDGARVAAAVEEVRELLRARGLDEVSWWVGERSLPAPAAAFTAPPPPRGPPTGRRRVRHRGGSCGARAGSGRS